jgi:hypothetical protein
MKLAVHQRRPLVLFDETLVDVPRDLDFLREALFLEVPDSKLISEGQKVADVVLVAVVFEMAGRRKESWWKFGKPPGNSLH